MNKNLIDPDRRQFCAHAAALALCSAAGVLFEGCSSPTSPSNAPSLPTVSGTRTSNGVTVAVAGTPIETVGGAALVQTSSGQFLVAQTAANTFVALTAICTHETCTITGIQNQQYVCPCHGSTFGLNGQVLLGPARVALRQYPTQFSGGTLTITA